MFDSNTQERFYDKIDAGPGGGCHLWVASRLSNGYGKFWLDGRMQYAHRVAWMFVNGPIPEGEGYHGTCVLHRCDNRACVRPDHLFLGSQADNMQDRNEKGRQPRGEANGRAKLTKEQIYAIRADTRLLREIAADYGISSQRTVSFIKSRTTWAHLPEAVT